MGYCSGTREWQTLQMVQTPSTGVQCGDCCIVSARNAEERRACVERTVATNKALARWPRLPASTVVTMHTCTFSSPSPCSLSRSHVTRWRRGNPELLLLFFGGGVVALTTSRGWEVGVGLLGAAETRALPALSLSSRHEASQPPRVGVNVRVREAPSGLSVHLWRFGVVAIGCSRRCGSGGDQRADP